MAIPQQEMLLNPAQFDTLCAKFDAMTTAVQGVSLTVTNPPVELAPLIAVITAMKQAVIDLNYTGLTIEIGDLRIDRAGKVMGG